MFSKKRAWIWFFVALVIASIGVAVFMIRYNLALQLTPEKLATARELWREQGPHSYELTYVKQIEGSATEKFVVRVKDKRVVEVRMNGMPLEERSLPYHSMDRLFSDMAQLMKVDEEKGRKAYARAFFDERNGALLSYVHRVMGTRERVSIEVINLKAEE